jgi:uncharacterized lipoprotein YddW (UPF0748 family)
MKTCMYRLACLIALLPFDAAGADEPPPVRREFRGVWVATVSNIDWPSRKGLSAETQKEEFVAILDAAVELKLNAVLLRALRFKA